MPQYFQMVVFSCSFPSAPTNQRFRTASRLPGVLQDPESYKNILKEKS